MLSRAAHPQAPFRESGMRGLMEAEEADLVNELASLPEDNVMNKINEIARRARLVQVGAPSLAVTLRGVDGRPGAVLMPRRAP